MTFDLDRYRERAETFCEELSREHYLHLSGRKRELEIEPIYQEFGDLFSEDAVRRLRDLIAGRAEGDPRRRLRYLLHFSLDGLVGVATRRESEELASLEASLEVDPGDGPVPYRAIQVEQANEPDPGDGRGSRRRGAPCSSSASTLSIAPLSSAATRSAGASDGRAMRPPMASYGGSTWRRWRGRRRASVTRRRTPIPR